MYGGVLSLFVKFSRSEKIKFVKFHTLGKKKKKTGKYGGSKKCAKIMSKTWEKRGLR